MICIFIGYVDGEFGYHLWDPVKHNIIRRWDVTFNELDMFKRPTGDMKVKKSIDTYVEQQENILLL